MILAIDTSSSKAHVAISCDGKITSSSSKGVNSHCESINFLVNDLLEKTSLSIDELDLILLGKGPGSFTGLRISYSYVRGLALACNIPVAEYSSLLAAVYSLEELREEKYFSVSDARRDSLFVEVCCLDSSGESREAEIVNIANLSELACSNKPLIVGEFSRIEDVKKSFLANEIEVFDPGNLAVGLLKHHFTVKDFNLREFESLFSLNQLEPNYLRQVAALKISER